MENLLEYVFNTKIGHFLFLMFFMVIITFVLSNIISYFPNGMFLLTTSFISLFLAITDDNENWY